MAETASKMEYHTDKIPRMIKLPLLKRSCVSGWESHPYIQRWKTIVLFRLKQSETIKQTNLKHFFF